MIISRASECGVLCKQAKSFDVKKRLKIHTHGAGSHMLQSHLLILFP